MGNACCKKNQTSSNGIYKKQAREIITKYEVDEPLSYLLPIQIMSLSNSQIQSYISQTQKQEEENRDLILDCHFQLNKEEYGVEDLTSKKQDNNLQKYDIPQQEKLTQLKSKDEERKFQQAYIKYQQEYDSDDSEESDATVTIKINQQRLSLVLLSRNNENFNHMKNIHSTGTISSSKVMKIGVDLFIKLKQGSIATYYTTEQVLGQGAYGKVWKVTHKTTGLVRAMKQIKKSSLIKEEEKLLFQEMNILKGLDHPHIVKLYELYQDNLSYYLITEYLSGGELFERIKQMQHFSEKIAADYIRQILMAVNYCHEQKIVHRDLKPENIIFVDGTPESNLKIIDFGTSRKFDPNKQMTKQLGTPYYIAPEVITQNYNEKCDIWSCGIILYILLCGYPPFRGQTEVEIIERVKKGELKFNPQDWDSISNDAIKLIKRMLTVDKDQRLSAKQTLQDPWLLKHLPTSQISKQALQNLSSFQATNIFKQALLSYMVGQMTTQKEIQDIQQTFQTLDKNSDGIVFQVIQGLLCKQELIEGYLLILNDRSQAEEKVEHIMAQVDMNLTGQVDFSEFLMAAMNEEKLLSVQKVQQAFQIFDQNGDGFLTKLELEQVMGSLDSEVKIIYIQVWNQILVDCGDKNDGRISQCEFTKLLQSQNN